MLELDGVDDYAQVADAPELDFGQGDFTLEVWIQRHRSGMREDVLTRKDVSANSTHDLAIGIHADGRAFGYLRESATTPNVYVNSASLPEGPVHLALTRSEGIATLYVNGVAQGSADVDYDVSSNGPLRIGGNRPEDSDASASPTYPFNGVIDEVRLWNRSRSADEISAAMGHTVDASSDGLVAYYRFDQRGAASVPDASGTVGEAELVNGAAVVD